MLDICKCPYCGAINQGEPVSQVLIDKDSYVEVMSCLKCHKEYHHIYQLVRVDTFDEKGNPFCKHNPLNCGHHNVKCKGYNCWECPCHFNTNKEKQWK